MQEGPHGDAVSILIRFNRLIRSIISNKRSATVYQTWEIQLLADINECIKLGRATEKRFDDYVKTARRRIEETGRPPMLLSVYLQSRASKRNSRTPSSEAVER